MTSDPSRLGPTAGGGAPRPASGSGSRAAADALRDPVLWGALAFGAVLRLARLGRDSLWLDEAISAWLASLAPSDLLRALATDLHPPGYYLLLHLWTLPLPRSVAGFAAEASLRSLSAAASLLTLPLVYCLGHRWAAAGASPRATARWATLIAAGSPFAVALGREARSYALLGLVLALELALFTRLRRGEGGRGAWAAFAIIAAVGGYVHYHAFLFSLGLAGAALLPRPGARSAFPLKVGLALLAAALLCLPLAPMLLAQAQGGVRGWVPLAHGPDAILRAGAAFFRGLDARTAELGAWAIPVAAILLLAARRGGQPLAVAVFAPLGIAYAGSLAFNIFDPRYFAGPAVAAWVLGGRTLAEPPRAGAGRIRRYGLHLILLAPLALGTASGLRGGPTGGEDWRGLAAGIAARVPAGTPVLFPFDSAPAPFAYYADPALLRGVGALRLRRAGAPDAAPGLAATLASSDTLCLIPYAEEIYDPARLLRQRIADAGFRPSGAEIHCGTLGAACFRRPPAGPG